VPRDRVPDHHARRPLIGGASLCDSLRSVEGRRCHTVHMGYVLGSQVESMSFTDVGAQYHPAGIAHAVDTDSETFTPEAVVGYAVCGTAVRVWPERPFDPAAGNAHDECLAITRGQSHPG